MSTPALLHIVDYVDIDAESYVGIDVWLLFNPSCSLRPKYYAHNGFWGLIPSC